MFIWIFLFINGITCLKEMEDMNFGDISKHKGFYSLSAAGNTNEFINDARFGDAEHRGSSWYSFKTSDSAYNSDADMGVSMSSSAQASDSGSGKRSQSSEASSQDTKEKKAATRLYRECTACPTDMLKSHKNIGIRWICGGYQRARRTFKSECMMRYRNCQDGTMFVKISEHRCKNDSFHGRHWFYQYKV